MKRFSRLRKTDRWTFSRDSWLNVPKSTLLNSISQRSDIMIVGEGTGSFNPNHSWLNAKGRCIYLPYSIFIRTYPWTFPPAHALVPALFDQWEIWKRVKVGIFFAYLSRNVGHIYRHHPHSPPSLFREPMAKCRLGVDSHQYHPQFGEFSFASYDERWFLRNF